jgi:hypothetical protein
MHFSNVSVFLQRSLFSLVLFFVGFFLYASNCTLVSAQEAGVSIKPARIEETLDPGTQKQYAVTIENLNNSEQVFYLFTRNIKGVQDGGVPIFAEDLERTGYELADWITLPVTELTLAGGAETTLDFTINVPQGASPGSHFGGVFISVDPPKIEQSGAAVGYQVANIISIRVSGDAVVDANIREFSTSQFLYGSQNVDFDVRIENKGNVLVRPVGPLEIYNMLGNKVGDIVFNAEQAAVFPYDTREYKDIKWSGDSIGFGRYEAILSPVYGDQGVNKTMSSTVTFWILPWSIIGPALSVFAVILLLTFVFVKVYIRRSLAHLNHGRRIVQRKKRGGSSAVLLVTVVALTVTALFLIVLLALFA